MAGYPPQQHFAAMPAPGPYPPPPYAMPPPVHHGYPPPMPPPGSGPYQSPYPPSNAPWSEQHYEHLPPPPPPPHGGMHGAPPSQPGPPTLPRRGYPAAGMAHHPSNGAPPPPMQHQQQHPNQQGFAPQMPPHDFGPPSQRPVPGPSHAQPPNQPMPSHLHQPPSQGLHHVRGPSTSKRGAKANSSRDKDRGGAAKAQQRASHAGKDSTTAKANAAKAEAAAARAEAARAGGGDDEPIQESKKIRKRKEVVDRIHRVHFDMLENRDLLYNDMQHALATTGSLLLLSPGHSRPYMLALQRLILERDAQIRQIALLHAHQVESARVAYEQDRGKVEEESRTAKRAVRERLLAAVEERRKRLRDDKEGAEGISDALLDSSSRSHATRKLRNKAMGSSRKDTADADGALPLSTRAKTSNPANGLANGGAGSDAEGTATPKGNGAVEAAISHPLLGSLLELTGLSSANGAIASLPPSNFDALTSGAATATLLHLGVGGGMGDSSYMANLRATLQSHGKGKKKGQTGKTAANASNAAANALNNGVGGAVDNSQGGTGSTTGALDDDDDEGASRTTMAAAAALAAATMVNGTGRLRWDQGKSVGQLTSAKDIEIESDLINIRKVGGKRRRR